VITISRFYLQQLIGDLCYSINKRTRGRIQRDLVALCDRLEAAERYGDGELDIGKSPGACRRRTDGPHPEPPRWCWCALTQLPVLS
jgi:hypothetical protein